MLIILLDVIPLVVTVSPCHRCDNGYRFMSNYDGGYTKRFCDCEAGRLARAADMAFYQTHNIDEALIDLESDMYREFCEDRADQYAACIQ